MKEILTKYPKVEKGIIDLREHRELGEELSIFTAPLILLFIEGKEVLRESSHLDTGEMDQRIGRYYGMLF